MALATKVKLSAVNNLSDARYGAGMGVAYMGFPMDEDTGISSEKYKEITSWVSGPLFVAEFEHPDTNIILEIISMCKPDFIEISKPEFLEELKHTELPVILRWPLSKMDSLPQHLQLDMLLLEDDGIQTLTSAQKNAIREICAQYTVLLGAGINQDNVHALLEEIPVEGIAIKGGEEIRPGYKDYDELADILESLEVD